MNIRSIARWTISVIATAFIVPFVQAPTTKLAEYLHVDTIYSAKWEAIMSVLSELAKNSWYIFAAGMAMGTAIGAWIRLIPEPQTSGKELSREAGEVKFVRTLLRLRFSGAMEAPHELYQENILSWFTYWSPGAEGKDQHGNIVFSVPSSWVIFVAFKKPTTYRQMTASFSSGRPHSYEIHQMLTTSAVITISGSMPACEMEIMNRE